LQIVHLDVQFAAHTLRLRAQRAEKAHPENSNQLQYYSHEHALLPFLTNTNALVFIVGQGAARIPLPVGTSFYVSTNFIFHRELTMTRGGKMAIWMQAFSTVIEFFVRVKVLFCTTVALESRQPLVED